MKANIEVTAYKNGKRYVMTWVKELYNGIAMDVYDEYVRKGYENVSVRII